jgi:hypothetical protein
VSPRTPRRGTPVTTARAPDPPRGVRDFHVPSGPPNAHTSTPTKGSGTAACPNPGWSTQDFDLRGPPNATAPHTEDRTSNSNDHAARKDWQDTGAISVG